MDSHEDLQDDTSPFLVQEDNNESMDPTPSLTQGSFYKALNVLQSL